MVRNRARWIWGSRLLEPVLPRSLCQRRRWISRLSDIFWESYELNKFSCAGERETWCRVNTSELKPTDLNLVSKASLAFAMDCPRGHLTQQWDSWLADFTPETPYDRVDFDPNRVVQRPVRVRNAPGLKTDTIGELPAQTAIKIRDCQMTSDNQGVWYQIDYQGQPGWISAKFAGPELSGDALHRRPIVDPRLTD